MAEPEVSPPPRPTPRSGIVLALGVVIALGGVAVAAAGWGSRGSIVPAPTSPPTKTPAEDDPFAGRTMRRTVIVEDDAGPVDEAVVRLVGSNGDDCARALTRTARTDADGVATLDVPDPFPREALIEVARTAVRGKPSGFRHVLHPWTGTDREHVRLPKGGTLRVVFEGLPEAARPASVNARVLAPPSWCRPLFPAGQVLPESEGGLFGDSGVLFVARVDAKGAAVFAPLPADHAVVVEPPAADPAWLIGQAAYTGPLSEGRDGEYLTIPEGGTATYTLAWRRRPTATVTVTDPSGAAVPGARVSVSPVGDRPSLFDPSEATDDAGRATFVLWTGPRLPLSFHDGLLVAATAPGRRGTVVEVPFRWKDDPEAHARVVLEPSRGTTWTVSGRVVRTDGTPIEDLPLRIHSAGLWNGQVLLDPLRVTTDADGRWTLALGDDAGPVLARGTGLQLFLDLERIPPPKPNEEKRRKGTLRGDRVDLPPEGGSATLDTTIEIPK